MNEDVIMDDIPGEPAPPADAIVKTVHVPLAPDRAFELFTARIAEWWPLATHSAGHEDAVDLAIDGRVGGLIVETLRDGSTSVWGTITGWQPPHALAFTWHPALGPEEATQVAVAFAADAAGCALTLVHTGWAKRRDGDVRDRYVTGWEFVLGRFVAAAA
ncbi:SRPBCC domain-containing protein [Agromyces sp. S2-1-8]|uniref:SRPBCC domain-containing protein n=1 Tax=Agromyces sp. S2-1-8 TaxID=2897180 RepID=UPI001E4F68FD|nr:SRPBCC domain-containing protein [Agromyces sp. S2-1-8]MCD5346597.1 SRPBCC domain-containing protein [Agromyces sp. S2-1-8]